jgi:hypothetical protein
MQVDLRPLLRSRKFITWRRPVAHFKQADHRNARGADGASIEIHYSPAQLAFAWGVSPEMVRSIFRNEAGVLKLGKAATKYRRSYFTLRIPAEVAERVHRKLSE